MRNVYRDAGLFKSSKLYYLFKVRKSKPGSQRGKRGTRARTREGTRAGTQHDDRATANLAKSLPSHVATQSVPR